MRRIEHRFAAGAAVAFTERWLQLNPQPQAWQRSVGTIIEVDNDGKAWRVCVVQWPCGRISKVAPGNLRIVNLISNRRVVS